MVCLWYRPVLQKKNDSRKDEWMRCRREVIDRASMEVVDV